MSGKSAISKKILQIGQTYMYFSNDLCKLEFKIDSYNLASTLESHCKLPPDQPTICNNEPLENLEKLFFFQYRHEFTDIYKH
jgi:YHS domain-containing protein